MKIVVDTSVIIAVITNERHKNYLIEISRGVDLVAPASLHWEIGNAFSAMFKRNRIDMEQAVLALAAYQRIPVRYIDIGLQSALRLSHELDIYAYDAYVIGCAIEQRCAVLSLDKGLLDAAGRAGVKIVEVTQ